MVTYRSLVFVLLAIVGPLWVMRPAFGEDCTSVIALSKIVSTAVADQESVDQHAAKFCSEYSRGVQSSSDSSFGASFKFLSASFGAAGATKEEVASKYCSASN